MESGLCAYFVASRGFLKLRGQVNPIFCLSPWCGLYIGYCPHTVTVYNRATIKGLIYPYYEYYSTVTEWVQYPSCIRRAFLLLLWTSFAGLFSLSAPVEDSRLVESLDQARPSGRP